MDQLIPIISRLQEVLQTIDPSKDCTVDLPRLVVVGAQSSGKSSVLETLVKKDFLPRGKDIVTRRPLVLQLIRIPHHHNNNNGGSKSSSLSLTSFSNNSNNITNNASFSLSKGGGGDANTAINSSSISNINNPTTHANGNDDEGDWAEFGHTPGRIFKDFDKIREEIEIETIRIAGNKKSISREPIYLRIYSKKVVDLTLVDLPGMTKIPIGEQPLDIESQLRSLILEYISKSNSIILAVTPANIDLVNSDALKLAREVDPLGDRTIGVLTKLDLMDAGTNALEILTNKGDFKLKFGYIGLVMRSQHDINTSKRIEEALCTEREFFRQHFQYRSVADRCGAIFLAKELNKILINHIKEQLPYIKTKINELIVNTQNELQGCGEFLLSSASSSSSSQTQQKSSLLLKLVTEYVSDFSEAIQGTFRGGILSQELIGGSRLNSIFNESFHKSIIEIDPISGLSHNDIRNAIRNTTGPKPALFVPEASFELLVKRQLKLLMGPSEKCVQQSFEELIKVISTIEKRGSLKRFPTLTKRINQVSMILIKECLGPCEAMIHNLLKIEEAYINTNHPDFWKSNQLLQSLGKVVEEKKRKETSNFTFFSDIPSPSSPPIFKHSASDEIILNPINTVTETSRQSSNDEGGLLSYLFPSNHKSSNQQNRSTADNRKSLQSSVINNNNNNTNNNNNNGASSSNNSSSSGSKFVPTSSSHLSSTSLIPPIPASYTFTSVTGNNTSNNSGGSNSNINSINNNINTNNGNGSDGSHDVEIQFILNLIQSYFQIVKKNLMDAVPKSIMHFLVNQVQDQLPARLVCELYKEELLEDLLREDESIIQLRDKCKKTLEIYRQASEMLASLGDQL